MKIILPGLLLAAAVLVSPHAAHAASGHINVDGVAVASDVKPETKNNRTMVPLRVISENLGAAVEWSNSEVTLTKDDMKVILKANSATAVKNGEKVQLDAKPYVKNNRVVVPLRFIAETFGCTVGYSHSTVTVDSPPLVLEDREIKTVQTEYHMTMGGVVEQITGNSYAGSIYKLIESGKGQKVDAPASFAWRVNIDVPGSYYKNKQYDFLDSKGSSVKSYDVYSLVEAFPAEELKGFAKVLIYDAKSDQWYSFSETARDSLAKLTDSAVSNGYSKVISNTVV
ncbi:MULTISPECIES: copper amine oxidase N-terminal domain-containing protein [unclassified Paenibacillus]|uniref:copper amine oxidase N-terminal domain-containing protein n=1 Tax=unclassified Paenibacillus TaxID=185978 RepID=UPI000954E10A|nr:MULTISPECIES: copper amine oxidase N-terminal domain-containing protein [unclassified Paenibacillus]ASS68268.1 copper amine oxidase N-terminal domain-containing protein [Paenibacillus sp. RUD330]SIR26749.1 Copper amine oxidase N-terminal domain-containing protein [Paenibacillus sp. RU4X]SIR39569.1 Copper amine oxidase N-terminal domain-containing protein [Paenibacillus sp. RU4T]